MRACKHFDYYMEHPSEADWEYISANKELTIDQIRQAKDHLNWYWITVHNTFTEDQVRQFADYIYWDWINFKSDKVNETFLREFREYISKWKFLDYIYFSKEFRRQMDYKDINVIIFNQFNEDEITEFVDNKKWDEISQKFWITDDFLSKFKHRLNWHILSKKHWKIETMWKFRNYWDWYNLTSTCVLKWKEYKITKFQKYVDWNVIKGWKWKNWSNDFKKKFGKRLGLELEY